LRDVFFDGVLQTGIFTPTELLVKIGDTVGGKLLTGVGDPYINNAGEVVFEGFYIGGNGIFALNADSLLIEEGDMVDGTVVDEFDHPAMNSNGVLIFNADDPTDLEGIYTLDRLLVQEGDIIEGKVLTNVGEPVINNRENFVF